MIRQDAKAAFLKRQGCGTSSLKARSHSRALVQILLAGFALTLCLTIARAHDGESHAEPEIQAIALPTEGLIAESAVSEFVELVLKHPFLKPGEESEWTLYLSDYESNRPIDDASITLTIQGQKNSGVTASSTSVAGVYLAKLLFTEDGKKTVDIEVTSEELDEILSIQGLQVSEEEEKSEFRTIFWGLLVGLPLLGLISFAAYTYWRKKKLFNISPLFFITAFLGTSTLYAHGGEDHGDKTFDSGSKAFVSGQPINLSKESQFLLGVRTVLVEKKILKKRIKTIGKVVPRRQGKADVYPPRSGRVIAHTVHYTAPRIGDRVKKGQIVAEIQTIDSFHVRAPISGVVTELNFAIGEQVETSRKLLTILDPRVLWVEASIFEPDLRAVEDSHKALITSAIYPELFFWGKLVALSAVFDEATRSVKAVFEFSNSREKLRPGMFVNVEIEAEEKEETLAVPASSVLEKDGTRVVFIHTSPEEFVMREVQVGGLYGDDVSIRSGIAEGNRVVTVGGYQLLTAPSNTK